MTVTTATRRTKAAEVVRAQPARFPRLQPAHALALPLAFSLVLVALAWVPTIHGNPILVHSFWGAAAALLAWNALLLMRARQRGRTLALDVALRKQHYLQACAQGSVLLYWGWYWRP